MSSTRGYCLVDIELEIHANSETQPDQLVAVAGQLHERIVIDWGFYPPNDFPMIVKLISMGADPWWFDGDRAGAQQSFNVRHARGEHLAPPQAFEPQMARIVSCWNQIEKIFNGRIIKSVQPGPSYMAAEDIFNRMGLDAEDGRSERT